MPITMSVRQHLLELGSPLDEGTVVWEKPRDFDYRAGAPLLAGVDPYGYTVFNRVQIDNQLPDEIKFMRARLSQECHPMLSELDRLVAVARQRPHRYVWFEGD